MPSSDEGRSEIVEPPTRYRYAALLLTGIFAAFAVGILTAIAFAVATATNDSVNQARYLISIFGFLIGVYGILFAFYYLFAPRVDLPFTPVEQPPDRWPLLLFCFGAVFILVNIRVFSDQTPVVFFWRVVGFAFAAAVVTGIAVYITLRYTGFQGFKHSKKTTHR